MGLINNDEYTANNGVQKTGTYISFSNETIYITQVLGNPQAPAAPVYQVRANYRVFWDQEARLAGKTFLDLQPVSTQVPSSALGGNMYDLLYSVLKAKYPNTTDVHDPIPDISGATGLTGTVGATGTSEATGLTGTSEANGANQVNEGPTGTAPQ